MSAARDLRGGGVPCVGLALVACCGEGARLCSPPDSCWPRPSAAAPAPAASKWTLEAGYTSENGAPLKLSAIWCTSTGWCAAVGNEDQGRGPTGVYAESGNGSVWTVAPSSGPSLERAAGRVMCHAELVPGRRRHRLPQVRFAPQRAMERPRVVRAPGPAGSGYLSGVSCVSRSFCMAVGAGQAGVPLVERWNGKQWSVVASPKKGSRSSELDAVACVSPTWCAAVGYYGYPMRRPGHPETRTLIELWNGRTWRIVPSPNTSGTQIVDPQCGRLRVIRVVHGGWVRRNGRADRTLERSRMVDHGPPVGQKAGPGRRGVGRLVCLADCMCGGGIRHAARRVVEWEGVVTDEQCRRLATGDSPGVILGRGVHHGDALQGRRRRQRDLHAQLTPRRSIPHGPQTYRTTTRDLSADRHSRHPPRAFCAR